MKATNLGRLGALAASTLLALQLFAGVGQAGVPTAEAVNVALPAYYSEPNDAGFRGTFTYTDTSTLAKLYLNAEITGGTVVTYISARKNGAVVDACEALADPVSVQCTFRTIRTGDVVRVTIGVTPASYEPGATVEALYVWSSTGYTTSDGGTSHGDTWYQYQLVGDVRVPVWAVATASDDEQDFAGGFDATSIANHQVLSVDTNPQAARLAMLPPGEPATLDDSPGNSFPCVSDATVDCSSLFGYWVDVQVGENATFGSPFQLQITYYDGTPKLFVHVYDAFDAELGQWVTLQETVTACAKKNPTYPCFTWSNRTDTATIYTDHNGGWKGG